MIWSSSASFDVPNLHYWCYYEMLNGMLVADDELIDLNSSSIWEVRKMSISYKVQVLAALDLQSWVMGRICFCPLLSRKRGDIKSHSSVCLSVRPSVCHKNFNLGPNFCTFKGRAFILGMCVLRDKTFPMVPCRDLDGDLWPTSRSNLLPSGGPQFSEFACWGLLQMLHLTYMFTFLDEWLYYSALYLEVIPVYTLIWLSGGSN